MFGSAKEEAASRARLFREIDRRRARMGMPQSRLVDAASVSSRTYEAARAGKTVPSWDTLTKLRDGLTALGARLEFEW
ncbi:MAG TPA: hypothetical protein PLJ34_03860 [Hyphomicrobiales bacterium]|nr:hypothetical protein [Hyphomicrobiales bacterium]